MPAKLHVRRPSALGSERARERGPEREIVRAADPVYAAAFQALPLAALILDANAAGYPVLHVNERFSQLTGYHPQELLGRPWTLLLGAERSSTAVDGVGAALAAGQGIEVSVEAFRKDGSTFQGAVSFQPVRHPSGELRWFLLTCSEAAPLPEGLRTVERESAERMRSLEEALERMQGLLHEVDHRVKNSLQVISSLMLLKARRTTDPATQRALHAMTERMAALATMHRLLSAGGDPTRFDLKSFVGEFVDDLGSGLADDRIALRSAVEPVALPSGQATPLALLINELAANALQHAFPDNRTGTVLIAASRHGGGLRLIVEDDGIGLAAAGPDGFGRALIGMLVRQLRGTLTFEDAAPGTRAVVAFPLQPTA